MNHELLLESWDRQCKILMNLVGLVNESNKTSKPSPNGWAIFEQLCHVHQVRKHWVGEASKEHAVGLNDLYVKEDDQWKPLQDLTVILGQLELSEKAVRQATESALNAGITKFGPYDHPLFFMQHMIWHEGYHFSLIMLALRNVGIEPSEEWEEEHIWGLWRKE